MLHQSPCRLSQFLPFPEPQLLSTALLFLSSRIAIRFHQQACHSDFLQSNFWMLQTLLKCIFYQERFWTSQRKLLSSPLMYNFERFFIICGPLGIFVPLLVASYSYYFTSKTNLKPQFWVCMMLLSQAGVRPMSGWARTVECVQTGLFLFPFLLQGRTCHILLLQFSHF